MQRREFLKSSVIAGSTAVLAGTAAQAAGVEKSKSFQLKYAPHFGMFKNAAGNDPIDQLNFAADQGFTAWEDNGMKKKPKELQQKIADTMEKRNMQMGVFVAHGSIGKTTFVRKDKDVWNSVLKDIQDSVEVAKRVNAKWMTVVPGNVDENPRSRLAEGYQTANVIELLRRCAEIFEPHGMVMVLEPLNWYANHGGTFLQGSPQAYAICKAVNSPACKILFDIYHQQITEGNLIVNIDNCWDEIGYFQSGDNPGRKEPGTGEINYLNVFKHIHSKDFDGVIGMEHGNSKPGKEGDMAVIEAYREVDQF
ncbi:Hydroxypyruvate isomerase [Gimesia alba]|uniref:Hydroxypyruvate isomerase n=1 Tax=Gimesia alba TaxID=2527973 RepID=A0A517RI56_9PLAN|nr:TIM barrel protein [Gimesia alba]QDT43559.1 Hydroxypyruvate isomerase [Gimesia alba]